MAGSFRYKEDRSGKPSPPKNGDTKFDLTDITTPPLPALRDLRSFAAEHSDGLVGAAALLCAAPGIRTPLAALDGLADPGLPTTSTMRALGDLLTPEHAHEKHRIEAACFAALDPAELVVEEIRLLAYFLADASAAFCQAACEPIVSGVAA